MMSFIVTTCFMLNKSDIPCALYVHLKLQVCFKNLARSLGFCLCFANTGQLTESMDVLHMALKLI